MTLIRRGEWFLRVVGGSRWYRPQYHKQIYTSFIAVGPVLIIWGT